MGQARSGWPRRGGAGREQEATKGAQRFLASLRDAGLIEVGDPLRLVLAAERAAERPAVLGGAIDRPAIGDNGAKILPPLDYKPDPVFFDQIHQSAIERK